MTGARAPADPMDAWRRCSAARTMLVRREDASRGSRAHDRAIAARRWRRAAAAQSRPCSDLSTSARAAWPRARRVAFEARIRAGRADAQGWCRLRRPSQRRAARRRSRGKGRYGVLRLDPAEGGTLEDRRGGRVPGGARQDCTIVPARPARIAARAVSGLSDHCEPARLLVHLGDGRRRPSGLRARPAPGNARSPTARPAATNKTARDAAEHSTWCRSAPDVKPPATALGTIRPPALPRGAPRPSRRRRAVLRGRRRAPDALRQLALFLSDRETLGVLRVSSRR